MNVMYERGSHWRRELDDFDFDIDFDINLDSLSVAPSLSSFLTLF